MRFRTYTYLNGKPQALISQCCRLLELLIPRQRPRRPRLVLASSLYEKAVHSLL